MAVELTLELSAQDFAAPSPGSICRKVFGDSLKSNAIQNMAAMVIPGDTQSECQSLAQITLRKFRAEPQGFEGLCVSNLRIAQDNVSAKIRKNLQVCFSHLRSGDAERYPHPQKRNSLLAAKIGGYQISINAKEEKLTM